VEVFHKVNTSLEENSRIFLCTPQARQRLGSLNSLKKKLAGGSHGNQPLGPVETVGAWRKKGSFAALSFMAPSSVYA
jgi:hypothetical protein